MRSLFRTLALTFGGLAAARAYPQAPALDADADVWVAEHFDRKAGAMSALTGWGTANVLVGGIGAAVSDGEEARQFHLMNAGWGAINAALGLFGRRSARRDGRGGLNLEAGYADLRRTEKILLFNAGLDVGYVAAGAYLVERSRRARRNGAGVPLLSTETAARDRGWGQAVMLQGAALCIFDLLAYRHLHRGEGALRIGGERGLKVRVW